MRTGAGPYARQVADPHPFRILVVCTANVCRSPLAERVLLRELAGTDVVVTSAGTHAEPGDPMCPGSAGWLGVDPTTHAARELDRDLLRDADLVLAADRTHRGACARLAPDCRPRLFTVRQAAGLASYVAACTADGRLPDGAPPLPESPGERLRWLVGEMDAARGLLPARPEEADDIADRHGPAPHADVFAEVDEATTEIGRAMRTCLSAVA